MLSFAEAAIVTALILVEPASGLVIDTPLGANTLNVVLLWDRTGPAFETARTDVVCEPCDMEKVVFTELLEKLPSLLPLSHISRWKGTLSFAEAATVTVLMLVEPAAGLVIDTPLGANTLYVVLLWERTCPAFETARTVVVCEPCDMGTVVFTELLEKSPSLLPSSHTSKWKEVLSFAAAAIVTAPATVAPALGVYIVTVPATAQGTNKASGKKMISSARRLQAQVCFIE
jgi:hypothetical protein